MSNTRGIAIGGILSASILIILYLVSILPTSRLFLLMICSIILAVIVIEAGIKAGWLSLSTTFLLSLYFLHDKFLVTLYALFFGLYGILKAYIEGFVKSLYIQYIVKLLFFNCDLLILYYLTTAFTGNIYNIFHYTWWVVYLFLLVAFIIYDYALTAFISYYYRHIKGKI